MDDGKQSGRLAVTVKYPDQREVLGYGLGRGGSFGTWKRRERVEWIETEKRKRTGVTADTPSQFIGMKKHVRIQPLAVTACRT